MELSQQQRAWLEGEAHDVAQICQHMQWDRKSAKDQILATFRIGEEEWHGQVDEHREEIDQIVCSALDSIYGVEVQNMPQRFYAEKNGASWCVRDREIAIRIGALRGQDHIVQWFSDEALAYDHAYELNNTRGHASDEPKCCMCGAQPAGGDPEYPRCGPCWSKLSRGD